MNENSPPAPPAKWGSVWGISFAPLDKIAAVIRFAGEALDVEGSSKRSETLWQRYTSPGAGRGEAVVLAMER